MDINNSIVTLINEADDFVGMGFFVSDKRLLTCFHVVSELGRNIRIRLVDGTILRARIVQTSERHDVAVLEREKTANKILPLPVGLINDNVFVDRHINIYSFRPDHDVIDVNEDFVVVQGGAQGIIVKQSQVINNNISGSPVVDEERQLVIGMVITSSFFIPMDVIVEIFPNLEPGSSIANKPDLLMRSNNMKTLYFDAYVSYNSHDRPDLAREIVGILEGKRLNVWYGEKYLNEVEDWREASREAFEKSSALVVLIGPNGIGRGQKEELRIALSFSSLVIVPVLLPGTTLDDLPEFLTYQDWIDFRTGIDLKSATTRLIKVIKKNNLITLNLEQKHLTKKVDQQTENLVRPQEEIRRILNANFSYSDTDFQLLKTREGLVAGEECYLLVDIGLPWKKGKSITTGKKDLTELLPSDDDYSIQVVFLSDDFEPQMTSAEIYVPANSQKSYPIIDKKIHKDPGPAVLKMKAPHYPKGFSSDFFVVHGRICLYYQNYLLQSAIVSVGVVQDKWVRLRKNNKIKVDYIYSGDFENISRQLKNRKIQFDESKEITKPVSLNLTMNDDGYGHHRIIAKYFLEGKETLNLPPSWKSYDPQAGSNHLEQFRNKLLKCYDEFDPRKNKNRRDKFIADLTALAIVGSKLYASAFSDLNCPDGINPWDWEEKFREITSKATVIQVSRTGPASYVFPWAMVYEFPLEEDLPDTYISCKSLWSEWDTNAIRTKETGTQCPHLNEHIEDLRKAKEDGKSLGIICPYAFWGYKHIIEQPLSVVDRLTSAPDCVKANGEFTLSIGITHDIDYGDDHLAALRTLMPSARLNPTDPADDRDKVRLMLKAPKIVYFLCHGEKDKGQTYINVGRHDKRSRHRIEAATLEQWKRSSIDKASWQQIHPLIFINGCGTADLRPGLTFSLVSAFANMEAGGVIGTEVSIKTDTAYPAGEFILESLSKGTSLGRAIREMRWKLLNRGDLLGLAYTPYGLADLHII